MKDYQIAFFIKRPLIILLTFLLISSCGEIKESVEIDRIFSDWNNPNTPGCALGIIKDGKLVYARGYGIANLEYEIPITENSVFRIASNSKQFTAACIVLLVEQAKLSLDDKLSDFYPEFPDYATKITIRHLLNHTSGIRDYLALAQLKGLDHNDYYEDFDVMEWLINQNDLNFIPGDEYLYSNSGYWLLGQIVNKVSGTDMAEFAKSELFDPLGMGNTHFHNDHTKIVENRASGYEPDKNGGYQISMTNLNMIGDGGIFTTINDMKKWDDAYYDYSILSEEFWSMMTQKGILNNGDTLSYASGLRIETYKGQKTIGHGGGFVGFRSSFVRFPEQKFSVVIFSNRRDANLSKMSMEVAEIFLIDKLIHRQFDSDNDEVIKESDTIEFSKEQITGHYELDSTSYEVIVKIGINNDSLFVTQQWDDSSYYISKVTGNTYQTQTDNSNITFIFSNLKDGLAQKFKGTHDGINYYYNRRKHFEHSIIDLDEYSGNYYSKELDITYQLFVKDKKIAILIGNNTPVVLSVYDTDQMLYKLNKLRFDRIRGKISGFELDAGRLKNLKFSKI